VMSLSLEIEATSVQRVPDPRNDRQVVQPVAPAAARPHPFSIWMDYIDFRHGASDGERPSRCDGVRD